VQRHDRLIAGTPNLSVRRRRRRMRKKERRTEGKGRGRERGEGGGEGESRVGGKEEMKERGTTENQLKYQKITAITSTKSTKTKPREGKVRTLVNLRRRRITTLYVGALASSIFKFGAVEFGSLFVIL
jgi:hypothetical protein